jgi:hypothetical protein
MARNTRQGDLRPKTKGAGRSFAMFNWVDMVGKGTEQRALWR